MPVAGCVRFVGETLPVFAFVEYAGVRVRRRTAFSRVLRDLCLFPPTAAFHTVLFQSAPIFYFFLYIGVGFDMGSIDKNRARI